MEASCRRSARPSFDSSSELRRSGLARPIVAAAAALATVVVVIAPANQRESLKAACFLASKSLSDVHRRAYQQRYAARSACGPLVAVSSTATMGPFRSRRQQRRRSDSDFHRNTLQVMAVSAAAVAAAQTLDSPKELFDAIRAQLSVRTPLKQQLDIIMEEGQRALSEDLEQGQDEGLGLFQELLSWLTTRQSVPSMPGSLGPLAVAALRHPGTDREIVIIGTPHGVPGVAAADNPVPAAVSQILARLKPDLVAVELDKARGSRELEGLPAALWGRASMLLPDNSPQSPDAFQIPDELRVDEDLMKRIKAGLGKNVVSVPRYVEALRAIFTQSSESCLAMNVMALDEFRYRQGGDWGRDATAAVEAAAKAGKPLLLCDLPQEWTLSRVVPAYNSAWVQSRQQRVRFLEDEDGNRAARFLEAEASIIREAVLAGHGGDLPALDYSLGLCRPAVGHVEAQARSLWLAERDPVMAEAVASALEGRARSAGGGPAALGSAKRAALQVGCNHVEGIAKALVANHGYQVVNSPAGGWQGTSVAATSKSNQRSGKQGVKSGRTKRR
ncbi:unnamed protein product [Polarella glacialis]|uniref:Uncharacterized protein n=1 Tax=Polarella glacialis TaxID=89957 RepID=A0A813H0F5_POLGL|nr:unnamed protein product [Polarella glacialis]